jgi:hypothetical protein
MALHAYWIENLDIRRVWESRPAFVEGCRYALVTSMDSIRDVAGLPSFERYASETGPHEALGRGALFEMDAFERLIGHPHFFTGFDEVWLFGGRPYHAKPESVWLTSEATIDPGRDLTGAAEWMAKTGCAVGMGDGAGLNYATLSDDVARQLDALDRS